MARIRLAKPSDARSVIEIIAESNHLRDNYPDNGFVERSTPGEWAYRGRISSTPLIYSAESGGEVVGFLAAYPLRAIWEQTLNNDPLVRELKKLCPQDVYFGQMAIRREWREKGIEQNLAQIMHRAAMMMGYEGIVGAIYGEPVHNTVSARFVEALGYIHVGLAQANGLGFNIYRKTLESPKNRQARLISELFKQALNL